MESRAPRVAKQGPRCVHQGAAGRVKTTQDVATALRDLIHGGHQKVVFDEGGLDVLCHLAAGTFDSQIFGLACDAVSSFASFSDSGREALKNTALSAVLPFRYAMLQPRERKSAAVSVPVARLIWQICCSQTDRAILRRLVPIINELLEQRSEGMGFVLRSCAALLDTVTNEDVLANFPKLGTCFAHVLESADVGETLLIDAFVAIVLIATSPGGTMKIVHWKLARCFSALFSRQEFGECHSGQCTCCLAVLQALLYTQGSVPPSELVNHLLSFDKTVYPPPHQILYQKTVAALHGEMS